MPYWVLIVSLTLGLWANEDFKKFEHGCANGHMGSCYNLGLFYYNGDGVDQSYEIAYELFTRACRAGIDRGCYNLGVLYYNGDGVEQDKQKAKLMYGEACKLGLSQGCLREKQLTEADS